MKHIELIAHRGYASKFPENTLIAISAALQEGVNNIEFDVQFSSDGTPFVLHDANLKRTAGVNKKVFTLDAEKVSTLLVTEAKKHPQKFADVGIPKLAEVINLLSQWPNARAFVEIKQETIDAFGIESVIRTLVKTCQPIIDRCILIAYDPLALRCSRAMGFDRIGLILKEYNEDYLSIAAELAPDFLFCNHTKLPTGGGLWPGPWRWAIYEVDSIKLALQLIDLGVDYLETMTVGELVNDARLTSRGGIAESSV